MNTTSLREVISQIRVPNKAVNADTKITSRYIYSLLKKHRDHLINQVDSKFYLYKLNELFQIKRCVKVIPVPTIDECCNVKTNCKIYRTKDKLPGIINSYGGPIIRRVTSIDGSTEILGISDFEWNRKLENPDSKYDKGKYYYWKDGYLYFPNMNWKKVEIEAYFFEDAVVECDESDKCTSLLDKPFRIPSKLLAQCIQNVFNDLVPYHNIPDDNEMNKNNTRRG